MRSVLKRCAAGKSLLSGESFIIPGLDSNKVTVVALENTNQDPGEPHTNRRYHLSWATFSTISLIQSSYGK